MKYCTTALFCLSSLLVYCQSNLSKNLWGAYFVSNEKGKLLNICENNEWYFTNCIAANIETSDMTYKDDCSFNDVFGIYKIKGDTLEMKDNKGEVFFLYQILDTMNLEVIYAHDFLDFGYYLNRHSAFFKGHSCRSVFYTDEFARWTVFEIETDQPNKTYEILRFTKPGFIFKNENYVVEQLPDSVFKEN